MASKHETTFYILHFFSFINAYFNFILFWNIICIGGKMTFHTSSIIKHGIYPIFPMSFIQNTDNLAIKI